MPEILFSIKYLLENMEGSSKKHPHTHKGKKFLEKKEGKLVEDTKIAIFMKGHKTSEVISECLKDMVYIYIYIYIYIYMLAESSWLK